MPLLLIPPGIKHNEEESSGVTNLYPDLNIQCLTQVPDTDIINETTQNQESHVSTAQTASEAKDRPSNTLFSSNTIDKRSICRLFQRRKCPHGPDGNKLIVDKSARIYIQKFVTNTAVLVLIPTMAVKRVENVCTTTQSYAETL